MAATTGLQGQVTSWAGTFNAAVLALLKPASFSVDTNAAELDTTGYAAGAAAVRSKIKGLLGWSGQYSGYLAAPTNGIAGSVTKTSGGAVYAVNTRSWSMSIRAAAVETTAWPVTNNWRTFVPGLVEWGGSFEAIVDDTTAVLIAGEEVTPSPLGVTFKLSSGNTLAGTVFASQAGISSRVGELQVVRYTYVGTGNVTSVGSENVMPANSGTIATPVAGAMELGLYSTTRKLTGSAFWTEISVGVDPNSVNQCSVSFQGSGALTPA